MTRKSTELESRDVSLVMLRLKKSQPAQQSQRQMRSRFFSPHHGGCASGVATVSMQSQYHCDTEEVRHERGRMPKERLRNEPIRSHDLFSEASVSFSSFARAPHLSPSALAAVFCTCFTATLYCSRVPTTGQDDCTRRFSYLT